MSVQTESGTPANELNNRQISSLIDNDDKINDKLWPMKRCAAKIIYLTAGFLVEMSFHANKTVSSVTVCKSKIIQRWIYDFLSSCPWILKDNFTLPREINLGDFAFRDISDESLKWSQNTSTLCSITIVESITSFDKSLK